MIDARPVIRTRHRHVDPTTVSEKRLLDSLNRECALSAAATLSQVGFQIVEKLNHREGAKDAKKSQIKDRVPFA